jgi:dihydroflavonol-4-reductase
MPQSRVLVTGAGGFIGRHVVRHQLARGRTVRALDRNAAGMSDFKPSQRLEVIVGDVCDPETQRKAVESTDLVFHLASAHLERGIPESEFYRVNVDALRSLLEASRCTSVRRFVHMSSCGIYGNVENSPANEDGPFHPDIVYEKSKLAGEQVARAFYEKYGFPIVIVRPVWVYGPGCTRTARLFRMISTGKFLMVGQGRNLRSGVYITDLLDALELCATRPGIEGEAFIVAHDELVTLRQIVDEVARAVGASPRRVWAPTWLALGGITFLEILARSLGRQPPISRRSLKFFTNDAGFTCEKARRMLGFEPRVSLRDGLELTSGWWSENEGRS